MKHCLIYGVCYNGLKFIPSDCNEITKEPFVIYFRGIIQVKLLNTYTTLRIIEQSYFEFFPNILNKR